MRSKTSGAYIPVYQTNRGVYATAEKVDLFTSLMACYSTFKMGSNLTIFAKSIQAGAVAYSPLGWSAFWGAAVVI